MFRRAVVPPLLAALCLGFAAVSAGAGPVLDRVRATGKIRIAHRESSIPFSYLYEGKPTGYAVELCQRLVDAVRQKAGLKQLAVEYVLVNPATRIPAIADGRAELECGSTTNNAERRERVAFTVPHYITGARYAVRADTFADSLAQFSGKTLVSTQGTTPLQHIEQANRERDLGINVKVAADHAEALHMVLDGRADGFAMDDVLLYGLIAELPDPSRMKVVGKFLTIEPLAVMLPKGDAEFKKIIDDEMKRLIQSHEAYALYERWFLQPIPPNNKPLNLPMNYLLRDFWKYPTDQVPF